MREKGSRIMKLVFVRHGDPDYERDCLTEAGVIEAKALYFRVRQWDMDRVFVSPLGRAQQTARLALGFGQLEELPEQLAWNGKDVPVSCREWLKEFDPKIKRPDRDGAISWDWLPADWRVVPEFFGRDAWMQNPVFAESGVPGEFGRVCDAMDALLAEEGYRRDGDLYRVMNENTRTLVFFCHFGLSAVLLSHLISAPPMVLWHGLAAAPTSVTVVRTEERRQGTASFRISCYGDTSHLYAAGVPVSSHARFTEVYSDPAGRHD